MWFVKEFAQKGDPCSNKELSVPLDAKCGDIVALFAAAANDPRFAAFAEAHPDAYRLVYNGRTLEGDTTLCDLGVGAGDCGRLSCLLKLKGGARPPQLRRNEAASTASATAKVPALCPCPPVRPSVRPSCVCRYKHVWCVCVCVCVFV